MQQVMTELGVSERDKIMIITKMVLEERKWLLDFIGPQSNRI
jgi:hypothetical protein